MIILMIQEKKEDCELLCFEKEGRSGKDHMGVGGGGVGGREVARKGRSRGKWQDFTSLSSEQKWDLLDINVTRQLEIFNDGISGAFAVHPLVGTVQGNLKWKCGHIFRCRRCKLLKQGTGHIVITTVLHSTLLGVVNKQTECQFERIPYPHSMQ